MFINDIFTDEKGFLVKKDMQKVKSILNLAPDILEDVFDSLDQDSNGYLTLNEFIDGFCSYTGCDRKNLFEEELRIYEENEEDLLFKEALEATGASSLFNEYIKELLNK